MPAPLNVLTREQGTLGRRKSGRSGERTAQSGNGREAPVWRRRCANALGPATRDQRRARITDTSVSGWMDGGGPEAREGEQEAVAVSWVVRCEGAGSRAGGGVGLGRGLR